MTILLFIPRNASHQKPYFIQQYDFWATTARRTSLIQKWRYYIIILIKNLRTP